MARLRAGRANTARGAAHFLRETLSRVRYAGATGQLTVRADSGFYTQDSGRPSAARWMSASPSPSASTPDCAISSRRYPNGTGRPYPTGWTAQPPWHETTYMSHSAPSPTPHRCVSSSEGSGPRPAPNWRSSPTTAITPSSRPRRGHPGTGGRPSPTRRDRERHPRPQVRCGTEPSALGALCRQRRLDGRAGDGSQPGPLDRPHRSGGAGGDHQDPQTTLLRPGRTAYTLGAPSHLALGRTFRESLRVKRGWQISPGRSINSARPVSSTAAGRANSGIRGRLRPDSAEYSGPRSFYIRNPSNWSSSRLPFAGFILYFNSHNSLQVDFSP